MAEHVAEMIAAVTGDVEEHGVNPSDMTAQEMHEFVFTRPQSIFFCVRVWSFAFPDT